MKKMTADTKRETRDSNMLVYDIILTDHGAVYSLYTNRKP